MPIRPGNQATVLVGYVKIVLLVLDSFESRLSTCLIVYGTNAKKLCRCESIWWTFYKFPKYLEVLKYLEKVGGGDSQIGEFAWFCFSANVTNNNEYLEWRNVWKMNFAVSLTNMRVPVSSVLNIYALVDGSFFRLIYPDSIQHNRWWLLRLSSFTEQLPRRVSLRFRGTVMSHIGAITFITDHCSFNFSYKI